MWALPTCACSCLLGDAATAVEVAVPGLCDERSVETGGWSRLHKCVHLVECVCVCMCVFVAVATGTSAGLA